MSLTSHGNNVSGFFCTYEDDREHHDRLKACPFCGTKTDLEIGNTHTTSFWVACRNCGVEVQGCMPKRKRGGKILTAASALRIFAEAIELAIEQWNTRHPSIASPKEAPATPQAEPQRITPEQDKRNAAGARFAVEDLKLPLPALPKPFIESTEIGYSLHRAPEVLRFGADCYRLALTQPTTVQQTESPSEDEQLAATLIHCSREVSPDAMTGYDLASVLRRAAERIQSLTQPTTVQQTEPPSERQQRLLDLANRIDHEELWRWAGMDHHKMTPEQKDRMNAGVALRRYANLHAPGRWLVFPPEGNVHFSASTLQKAAEMAAKSENRGGNHTI